MVFMRIRWQGWINGIAVGLGLALALTSHRTQAADRVYGFVIEKQEQKAKNRWSLSEWLEVRDRMKWMDLWLAMHTPSPYEFFAAPIYRWSQAPGSGGEQGNWSFHGGAYASVTGLEIERDFSSTPDLSALLALRVFGYHTQGTHLSLQGGVRIPNNQMSDRNPFAGGELVVYFGRFFGLEGVARYHFPASSGGANARASGWRRDIGAFIDFKWLRVFANEREEPIDVGGTSTRSLNIGTKLFF